MSSSIRGLLVSVTVGTRPDQKLNALGGGPVRSGEGNRHAGFIPRYGSVTVTLVERGDPGHQAFWRNIHPATAPGRWILHDAPP